MWRIADSGEISNSPHTGSESPTGDASARLGRNCCGRWTHRPRCIDGGCRSSDPSLALKVGRWRALTCIQATNDHPGLRTGHFAEQARAAEDHRSTQQFHGTWRERIGRFPSGDPVATGLRVLSQAYHYRLGSRAHRTCVGRADEAPWIHAICGPRRRFGRGCLHCDGQTGGSGIAGHSHQLPRYHSSRHCEGAPVRRSAAIQLIARRKTRVRTADHLIYEETRLCTDDGNAPTSAVWIGGFLRGVRERE